MTVAELIAELQKHNPASLALVWLNAGGYDALSSVFELKPVTVKRNRHEYEPVPASTEGAIPAIEIC